jgi:DnaJ-domain-containing protein 1
VIPAILKSKEKPLLIGGRAKDEDIKALFELLGIVAKANGRVTQNAIQEVEKFISIYLDPSQRQYAISCFKAGKECPALGAAITKRAFHLYGFRDYSDVERWLEPLQIIDTLLRTAFSDRYLTFEAEYIIDHARSTLAIHKRAYWIMRDTLAERLGVALPKDGKSFASLNEENKTNSKSEIKKPSKMTRSDALKLFLLNEDVEYKQIKTAYRSFVKLYHPDAIMKGAASDAVIKEAIKNFCAIQEAYELLSAQYN